MSFFFLEPFNILHFPENVRAAIALLEKYIVETHKFYKGQDSQEVITISSENHLVLKQQIKKPVSIFFFENTKISKLFTVFTLNK